MAFAKGKQTSEGGNFKLYTGAAACTVVALNPNKEKIKELTGREMQEEPQYISDTEVDGKTVKQIRLDFYMHPDPKMYVDNQGQFIDTIIPFSLFLRQAPKVGKNTGKACIIDKYGRTAWATPEDVREHRIPIYSNGKEADISQDYKVALVGEEELRLFLKNLLNIKDVKEWRDHQVVGLIANPEEAETTLEHMDDYFKGDISELRTILSYQPNNKINILFGVRSTSEGRMFQDAYSGLTAKYIGGRFNQNMLNRIYAHVSEAKGRGALANREYDFNDFHEFSMTPTNFETPQPETTMPSEDKFPWE